MSNANVSTPPASGSHAFLSKPTTRIGWWVVWLFFAVLAFVLLNTFVIMPYTEARSGFDTAQMIYNAVVGLSVLVTALLGIVAIAFKGERSWAVVIVTLLPIIVLTFEAVEIISSTL